MEGAFAGTWYRSEIRREGDTIIPVPPFEAYDPFTWYYSANDIRQKNRSLSLHLEFLAVDSKNPEEVVNFCRRFGVLGDAGKARALLKQDIIKEARTLFKTAYGGMSPTEKKCFIEDRMPLVKAGNCLPKHLCSPSSISEFVSIQRFLNYQISSHQRLSQDGIKRFFEKNKWASIAPSRETTFNAEIDINAVILDSMSLVPIGTKSQFGEFAYSINEGLDKAAVSQELRWNVQKNIWELGWLSYSLLGYFWVMLMLDQLGPGKILSCLRCQKFFMTASNRTKHCSPSCRENFKVQNYRQSDKGQEYLRKKKEREVAAQKEKKAKAKKSTAKNK